MNDFINTHGDVIFNCVFLTVIVVAIFAFIYAYRITERDRKAFLEQIKKERQEGYLAVSSDGRVLFVRTNGEQK